MDALILYFCHLYVGFVIVHIHAHSLIPPVVDDDDDDDAVNDDDDDTAMKVQTNFVFSQSFTMSVKIIN